LICQLSKKTKIFEITTSHFGISKQNERKKTRKRNSKSKRKTRNKKYKIEEKSKSK
jgi:hypothetical protein